MTRQEIEALTPDALTEMLASRVMGWEMWKQSAVQSAMWKPTSDANDLRELVSAVPENLRRKFELQCVFASPGISVPFGWWLLTCDQLIVCRAIAIACCGGDA